MVVWGGGPGWWVLVVVVMLAGGSIGWLVTLGGALFGGNYSQHA